jgi:hypothetical protein
MEVSGDLRFGEGRSAGLFVRNRLLGRARLVLPALSAAFVVLAGLGMMAAEQWPRQADLIFFAGLFIACISYALYCQWAGQALRRAWLQRGISDPSPTTYSIQEDGLAMVCPGYRTHLQWQSVSELSRSGLNWIFIADGMSYFLPRRLFSGEDEEKAFIEACREHMTGTARARSVEH